MAAPLRPRAMILSVFGAFVRRVDGWMPIAGLIDLMAELGVDQQAVRSSISRLKRRGVLLPERRGGAAGYRLSAHGLQILRAGDVRIYERPHRPVLADGWVLAVFSVPDSERAARHVLRSQLTFLGFAPFSAGVWLAPGHVADEARAVLQALGLDRYVHLFRADYLAYADPADWIGACWDIDELARAYLEFLTDYRPVLEAWNGASVNGDERAAFVDHVRALTAWRRLPFLDPGLPVEVLPPTWPGRDAWNLFHTLSARLDEPSLRHVRRVLAQVAPVRG